VRPPIYISGYATVFWCILALSSEKLAWLKLSLFCSLLGGAYAPGDPLYGYTSGYVNDAMKIYHLTSAISEV